MGVGVQTQKVSCVTDRRLLGCGRRDLGETAGNKQKKNTIDRRRQHSTIGLRTVALPGSQHQTAVRWAHVIAALHWGPSKKRTLLQTDHSGRLGRSWIPSLDCPRPLESNAHLQTQETTRWLGQKLVSNTIKITGNNNNQQMF